MLQRKYQENQQFQAGQGLPSSKSSVLYVAHSTPPPPQTSSLLNWLNAKKISLNVTKLKSLSLKLKVKLLTLTSNLKCVVRNCIYLFM